MLKALLARPCTRAMDIDDPATSRRIIRSKAFLKKIYEEWANQICTSLPGGDGHVLELGSGAGILSDDIPCLITSDVFQCSGLSLVADARRLPLGAGALRSIVMIDVLLHIPDSRLFFEEAVRCVRPGRAVIMIEPWVSAWSRLIYRNLDNEPFEPEGKEWSFPSSGPHSGANGALQWIMFVRDAEPFRREFAGFEVESLEPMMPFCYLLSGGVSLRSRMTGFTFGLRRRVEQAMRPWMDHWAMFSKIVLRRM